MNFRDYDVRVWADGDVNINSERLGYATLNGSSGLQCNVDQSDPMHRAVRLSCMDAAAAMRALDEVLTAVEKEDKC